MPNSRCLGSFRTLAIVVLISSLLGVISVQPVVAASDVEIERLMFAGESAASRLLLDQLGQAVQQVLHPLCRHTSTTASSDGRWWAFTTRYVFGKREHTLVWRLSLKDGLVNDFDAVSDTSPIPSAKLAVKAKEKIAPLVKAYLEKR